MIISGPAGRGVEVRTSVSEGDVCLESVQDLAFALEPEERSTRCDTCACQCRSAHSPQLCSLCGSFTCATCARVNSTRYGHGVKENRCVLVEALNRNGPPDTPVSSSVLLVGLLLLRGAERCKSLIESLEGHEDSLSSEALASYSEIASVLFDAVSQCPGGDLGWKPGELHAAGFRLLCRLSCNGHALVIHAEELHAALLTSAMPGVTLPVVSQSMTPLCGKSVGRLLDPVLSMPNHSCWSSPTRENTKGSAMLAGQSPSGYLSVSLQPGVPPTAMVRAARALEPGDAVTLSYLPISGQGRSARRAALRGAYFFKCACPACSYEKDGDYCEGISSSAAVKDFDGAQDDLAHELSTLTELCTDSWAAIGLYNEHYPKKK